MMCGDLTDEALNRSRFTPSQKAIVDMIVEARRERNRWFAKTSQCFSNPGWDIVADLASAGLAGRRVSVSSACLAAGVPQSTALRYVGVLETDGFISRIPDPTDGRRFFLRLTERGWSQLQGYIRWLEAETGARGRRRTDQDTLVLDRPPTTARSRIVLEERYPL